MNFYSLANGSSASSGGSIVTVILMYAVIIAAFYFIAIRPQSKRKKKEEKMRSDVQIGDNITTIGGISGRVVGIKDDANELVLETGSDRAKLRIKRWAIGSIDTIHEDAE